MPRIDHHQVGVFPPGTTVCRPDETLHQCAQRRGQEKAAKRLETITGLGFADKRSVEEWEKLSYSTAVAIDVRTRELELMKMVHGMIVHQLGDAKHLGIELFALNPSKKPPAVQKGKFRGTMKGRISEDLRSRAQQGFEFFDRMMRQGPRPGTIKQEVSQR